MDFMLTKKHEMARTLFREFAEKEVKPLAQEVDETEQFPAETVAKLAKAGFLGIPVPKEYGGQGCDILTYTMCVEEMAKVCGAKIAIHPEQVEGTFEKVIECSGSQAGLDLAVSVCGWSGASSAMV